jgi:tetratricopeptide (TPR) repeat protein
MNNLQDFQGAIANFDKAIELDPKSAVSYYERGLTKTDLRDYSGALSDFNIAFKLGYHDSEELLFTRGLTKFYLSDYTGAITDFTKAIELDPNNSLSYYLRGGCQIILKNYNAGCLDLKKSRDLGLDEANEMIRKYCNN